MSMEIQVPIIYAGVNGLVRILPPQYQPLYFHSLIPRSQLDSIPVDKITQWEQEFREHLTTQQTSLLETIATGNVTGDVEERIKKVVEDHVSQFSS